MAFTQTEKLGLLAVKGIGPTVILRLEQIGIDSFAKLAAQDAKSIAETVASMLNTTCWKNSPQALSALEAAISRAKTPP